MKKVIITIVMLLPAVRAFGAELLVPSQYPTIQSAIDAAAEGDAIIAEPGIYYESISVEVNNLTLTSTNPADPDIVATTVIDGNGANVTIGLINRSGCSLTGLTIQSGFNGIGNYNYAGFAQNLVISHCVIRENKYGITGYGTIISNCLIYRNVTSGISGCDSSVINCTIADNNGWGITGGCHPYNQFINCIIWGNEKDPVADVLDYSDFQNCCVQGGYSKQGNINEDPLFVDAANGDYRLQAGSPCIDTGKDTWSASRSATDLNGNYRQIDGDEDGSAVIDMGAYEYGTATRPFVGAQPKNIIFFAFENGTTPESQKLYIRNIGPGTLNWLFTENCQWLDATPSSGVSEGQECEITVTIDPSGLDVGRYTYNLEIRDAAGGSRDVVQVDCIILDESHLNVPSEYPTIQSAIDAASDGDTVVIAPGTYTGQGNCYIRTSGKIITIRSTDPNDQWVVNNTVIKGGFPYSVVASVNSVIDGLTITRGGRKGNWNEAGIYIIYGLIRNCNIRDNFSSGIRVNGEAMITNCRISGNQAPRGGGIYIEGRAYNINYNGVIINNCVITENSSSYEGGGIYANGETTATIVNCQISGNKARIGAGVFNERLSGNLKISKSVITGNIADTDGGGIYNKGDYYLNNLEISDSIVGANFSSGDGGGLYIGQSGWAKANRCTIAGNTAGQAGGGVFVNQFGLDVSNCILWGNSDANGTGLTAQVSSLSQGNQAVFFSCIQDEDPGDANVPFGGEENFNIDDDPLFVREPNDGGDGWGVGNNDDYGDLHLTKNSPCIDTGNPICKSLDFTDIDGQPRVMGQAIDMGADEYDKIIVVTKPKADEVWAGGSKHLIKWSVWGANAVDILFSANGGANWETIAQSVTDVNNSYLWIIQNRIDSNQCVISILPADGDPNVCCRQSGLFAIKPYPRRPPVPFGWFGRLPPPDLSNNKGPRFGCVKWVFETEGAVFSKATVTRPAHRGGYKIYAGCETGQIYAINNMGELLWSFDTNAPIVGSPGIGYYDMVYVGAGGRLYAFDEDGELRWTFDTEGPIYSAPVVGYDGKIYLSSQDGTLYAIRPDGTSVWTFATKGPGRLKGTIFAAPVIDKNGTVYVTGFYDPNLYALDADSGNIRWVCNFEFPVDPFDPNKCAQAGMPYATCAVGRDGTIYQTLIYDPNLYAIDSADGTIIWRTNLADPCCGWFDGDFTQRFGEPSGWCEPVIGPEGTIYVSFDDPYLRAVKPDGTIKWVSRLGMVGGFTLSVGVDGLIYAASDDGFVCVVDSSGREVSRFKGNGWVSFPVIAEDGTLIVSDANNILWAISSRGCRGRPPALHIAEDIQPSWNVDFMDLALLANSWLECTDPFNLAPNRSQICGPGIARYGAYPPGDVDRDQYVDFKDFAAVAEKWLTETHWYYHWR